MDIRRAHGNKPRVGAVLASQEAAAVSGNIGVRRSPLLRNAVNVDWTLTIGIASSLVVMGAVVVGRWRRNYNLRMGGSV